MDPEPRASEPNRRRKTAFHVIAISLMIAIPFLLVEVYLRVTKRNTDLMEKTGRTVSRHPMSEWALVDAFCAYRARPGTYGRLNDSAPKTVNSHGFISTPELTTWKSEGTVRIAFLGGSSTAGTGRNLADRDTWPWRVYEMLAERHPDTQIEFINGALGGYSSFESYGRLWSRIRFFSPDFVVVYHGWNEIYYFNRVDTLDRWRTFRDGSWSFDRTERIFGTHKPYSIDHVLRHSQVLTRLRLRWGEELTGEVGPVAEEPTSAAPPPPASPPPPPPPPPPPKRAVRTPKGPYDLRALDVWRTNLRLLRDTAGLLQADLLVAKQATLIVPGLSAENRQRCRYDYHGFDHETHVKAFNDLYLVIDEEIDSDRVIDVTTISGRSEYFHDHVHPTVEGSRAIAEIVADALSAHLSARGEVKVDLEEFR